MVRRTKTGNATVRTSNTRWTKVLAPFAALVCLAATPAFCASELDPSGLAVIVNTMDPSSLEIGRYYAERRRIPRRNILRVEFLPGRTALSAKEFAQIRKSADEQAPQEVQAYALTWAMPYQVGCMSITSAFAFGFDSAFCASECAPTRVSAYYNSRTTRPFTDLGVRPTMAIAATSIRSARTLIDRGVGSDGTFPPGTAYLLSTSDPHRNVRSSVYPLVEFMLSGRARARTIGADTIRDARDVLFYFTGQRTVENLETLRFVRGAIADHLTSFGGQLDRQSGHTSALRWLEAGATGSFGTVTEPCNFAQKFPDPALVVSNYLQGDTLIEAYWKSVAMPGQGIFIGEPLAAPFRPRSRK